MIVGPTGAGKTRLALELAGRVGGEVVSADSQQVYVGMDIGTGKATADERARVPHHLLDVVRPDEEMTAARFIELADRRDRRRRGARQAGDRVRRHRACTCARCCSGCSRGRPRRPRSAPS